MPAARRRSGGARFAPFPGSGGAGGFCCSSRSDSVIMGQASGVASSEDSIRCKADRCSSALPCGTSLVHAGLSSGPMSCAHVSARRWRRFSRAACLFLRMPRGQVFGLSVLAGTLDENALPSSLLSLSAGFDTFLSSPLPLATGRAFSFPAATTRRWTR